MTLVLSALALGAVYAMLATGYNIVFIASSAFNFAQAHLMMLGAFVAYAGLVTYDLSPLVVVVAAIVVVAVVASIEERIAIRPVSDSHTQLITTLGFGIVLTGFAQLIWGSQPHAVPFVGSDDVVSFLGGRVYPVELVLVVAAVLIVVGLQQFMHRTMTGLAIVSISEDREASALRGVNVRALGFLAFTGAGALAGLMGVLMGPKTYAFAALGSALALKGFTALALGGFGSLYGGLIGGFVVGLVEQLSTRHWGSEFSNLSVFLILMAVLLLRPNGLFGRTNERRV